jgi:hypothetical protein
MSKDDDTLKVTDDYLKGVALNQINRFVEDLRSNPAVAAVYGFADAGDSGSGAGGIAGEYTKLMPGGGPLTSAGALKSRFKALCVSLEKELKSLDQTMNDISADLQAAQLKLQNGADEALSAAQMMQVLDEVYGGLNGPGGPGGNGHTPVNDK